MIASPSCRSSFFRTSMKTRMSEDLWIVILAAGAGRRLSALTGGVPKQFWRGLHGTSLLRQTIERFTPLAPASRTVVIVDAGHLDHVAEADVPGGLPVLVVQPEDRGTAAGVLLALTPVLASTPDAVVVITPSDHGVRDDSGFRRGVLEAARRVRAGADVVLFGVEPATAQRDYGWISLRRARTPSGFWPVESFVEKPSAEVAAQLFGAGAVWNTMVMVARAAAIRDLYVELLPNLAGVFADALQLPAPEREAFLATAYPTLPKYDFSRDLVARSKRMTAYVWPASLGWSDLGTPERLDEWQSRVEIPGPSARAIPAA
jgi:mannose-1-phosphate guanylyltransferase